MYTPVFEHMWFVLGRFRWKCLPSWGGLQHKGRCRGAWPGPWASGTEETQMQEPSGLSDARGAILRRFPAAQWWLWGGTSAVSGTRQKWLPSTSSQIHTLFPGDLRFRVIDTHSGPHCLLLVGLQRLRASACPPPAPRSECGALSSGVDVSGQYRLRARGVLGAGVCVRIPEVVVQVPVLTYQAANSQSVCTLRCVGLSQ